MSEGMYTDTLLLQGIATGSSSALQQVYKVYYPQWQKWMMAKGGMELDAEDVFQESLVVVYNKACDTEFVLTAALGTYIFAIAKRMWYRRLEQQQRLGIDEWQEDISVSDNGYHADVSAHLEQEERFNSMYAALEELGAPCNQLLKAFYIEGQSMQQISDKLAYSNAETAKTQKYKCLTRLKKLFFHTKQTASNIV